MAAVTGDLVVAGDIVDAELVPASTPAREYGGKIGRVLAKLDAGELADPEARRAPGAAKYHEARLSDATKRAYTRWIRQWLYFCDVFGREDLPASDLGLEHFMVWLAELDPKKGKNAGKMGVGLSPASLRQALAAVHYLHDMAREGWPSTKLANGIIEGHANRRARPGSGVKDDQGVPPVKLPTLLELIRACPVETNAGIRDRAMLACGFAIMARRSELSSLDIDSITPEDGDLHVHVSSTKTNRLKGRDAYLPHWDAYPECSPVLTMNAWIARLAEQGITSGALFRAVDQWDHVAGGPDPYAGPPAAATGRMAPDTVELVIARAALAAVELFGIDIPNLSDLRAHSLRAGGATSSYEGGADILSIARQGGWGDRSPVVFRYIRGVDLRLRNPMRLLGKKAPE